MISSSSFHVFFTFVTPLLFSYRKATTLHRCPSAGCLPSSLTVLRQSIYPDLARIDGGCRDCGVDRMLQVSTLIDTLPSSHKMEPACNHLTC